MSTPTDTHDDAFETELAARMGAATDTVTAEGVTREGVDQRLAARRAARRRRQGGIVLAAAALVIAAGVGALALGTDEPDTTIKAGPGDTTTEVPTTEAPETTSVSSPDTSTTAPTVTTAVPPPTTETAPTTTQAPPQDTAPEDTAPLTTEGPATTTTEAPLNPGQPCPPGSSPDCIDPEGDGSSVYLIGGAECMASPIGGAQCADLDGDGHAGYPDGQ